jgi:hypothetical protein
MGARSRKGCASPVTSTTEQRQRAEHPLFSPPWNWARHCAIDIVARYGVICLEDLKLVNMTTSAKGTKESPGERSRTKTRAQPEPPRSRTGSAGLLDLRSGTGLAPYAAVMRTRDLTCGRPSTSGTRHRGHLPADVDRDDVCTLLGQPHGVTATLTTRRSGDECNFSFPAVHGFPPISWRCIEHPPRAYREAPCLSTVRVARRPWRRCELSGCGSMLMASE